MNRCTSLLQSIVADYPAASNNPILSRAIMLPGGVWRHDPFTADFVRFLCSSGGCWRTAVERMDRANVGPESRRMKLAAWCQKVTTPKPRKVAGLLEWKGDA